MNHSSTPLRKVVSSVHQIKVDGFCITKAAIENNTARTICVKSRCNVDGHDWEIRFHPALSANSGAYWPGLYLVFLGEPRASGVMATLSAKIVAHVTNGDFAQYDEERKTTPKAFHRPLDRSQSILLGWGWAADEFKSCSFTVEYTIAVSREAEAQGATPVPSYDLPRHFGDLLLSQAGADVTFSVSGKSIAAHKTVLAARSPVFMAEFFGEMKEARSQCVDIQDMDDAVFNAMLEFIYTDAVPELDEKPNSSATMTLAQHLLVAADRYGLDRLKVMCERRLIIGMDVRTVASTLALAEQHNFSVLKAKCIEFIVQGSQKNLDAVLATEAYKDLVASSPMVMTELLKAAHGKKRRSPDAP